MVSIIVKPDPDSPSPKGVQVKGGDGYSRCPEDGCLEVERRFKIGGQDMKGENHLDAEIYHADRAQGGCGANWAPDTKQGAERNRANLGREPRWLNDSAATDRSYSLAPQSQEYADNYRRIFGHD